MRRHLTSPFDRPPFCGPDYEVQLPNSDGGNACPNRPKNGELPAWEVGTVKKQKDRLTHSVLVTTENGENVQFDPAKDEVNVAKHGISLARAADFEVLAYVDDQRFAEPRFRLYGMIDGVAYCLAGTDRDGVIRVISLRRAHAKEMRRYVE